ncbi:hypothetical protein JCM11641_000885 [Rhodosporidiobolus odoratus]
MRSILTLSFLSGCALAARELAIKNECDFELWPAVLNTFEDGQYTGPRGWVAPAGYTKKVTIPEKWNGRVWARRGCTFDSDGSGSCLAGDCGGGLECKDATMGWANLFEVNLDSYSGLDFWDISAVPGFTVPMSVVPSSKDCDAVVCSKDLNPTCPEALRVYDTDGKTVITCFSACMAGVNAEGDNPNCCSGAFNDLDTCKSADVDYYNFFKDGCENAYAVRAAAIASIQQYDLPAFPYLQYPYDSRPNSPTVDQACSADSKPSYEITFCPDGKGSGSASSTAASSHLSSSTKSTHMSSSTQSVEVTTSHSPLATTSRMATSTSRAVSSRVTTSFVEESSTAAAHPSRKCRKHRKSQHGPH